VVGAGGVPLAVQEHGAPDRPTILAVHGYPDDHAVWDAVASVLATTHHVVTYDVRGAGASGHPDGLDAYRMPQLLGDLGAVLDHVAPDRAVHLVGHDWGSIQGWAAIRSAELAGRFASFTSVSGPALDYSRAWLRAARRHPRAAVRQLARSYYLGLFQLPLLPEAAVRSGLLARGVVRAGRRAAAPSSAGDADPTGLRDDMLSGLALYRANLRGRYSAPRPVPPELAVQLIVPERDAFVTPELAVGAAAPWAARLVVQRIVGGHWPMLRRPGEFASLVGTFVDATN
jgi:pimeloyl-ACP methyl ester carboxylesterase